MGWQAAGAGWSGWGPGWGCVGAEGFVVDLHRSRRIANAVYVSLAVIGVVVLAVCLAFGAYYASWFVVVLSEPRPDIG